MNDHHSIKISDILRRLLYQKNMKVIDLARATNVPQPTLQRIVTGGFSRKPQLASLEPLAKYFSITIDQLLGKEPIQWLEQTQEKELKEMGIRRVPLLDWSEVISWINTKNQKFLPDKPDQKLLTESPVSQEAFALSINDASMEPLFPIGCKVIFDPNKELRDRSYVLVKLTQKNEPIFRQLILDAGDRFIKPLSPDLEKFSMHMLEENDIILGNLIESKNQYF